uniref:Uncharacterized protein n=1 Tax=Solanum lycopersicum TaxID=4081 RepID=A0A3Q7H5K4_SOLLC
MPNFFVDIRQDLVYAYGCPSRLVRPIWKVKGGPKRDYPSFRRFSCAIAYHFLSDSDSDVKNAKFFVDVRQDLFYAYSWPSRLVRPIWKVKRAPKRAYPSFRRFSCAIAYHFLGDPNFDVKNAQFFRGCPSRPWSNKPRSEHTPHFDIAHHFLGDPDFDVKNAKFFHGRPSRPCLCIRLTITACPFHLVGQTSPEASILLISMIFVCSIAHHFLGDPDSDVKNAKFFRGCPSRPCLCIRLAITACSAHLKAHHFLGDPDSDVKNSKFFRARPSRPYLCIRLAITACPTHLEAHHFLGDPDSDVKNAKFFHGCPSRLCVCIRLAITAYPTHLEAHQFLGDSDSDVKNAKFFRTRSSRPYLCIQLAIMACPAHLIPTSKMPNFFVDVRQDLFYAYRWPSRLVRPIWKAKRAPERAYPLFRRFSSAIEHHFLGDPDSDVKNAKFFLGRPSRPCKSIRLAITTCPTYLEGQTSPEASIPLSSTIFVCYPFFG